MRNRWVKITRRQLKCNLKKLKGGFPKACMSFLRTAKVFKTFKRKCCFYLSQCLKKKKTTKQTRKYDFSNALWIWRHRSVKIWTWLLNECRDYIFSIAKKNNSNLVKFWVGEQLSAHEVMGQDGCRHSSIHLSNTSVANHLAQQWVIPSSCVKSSGLWEI